MENKNKNNIITIVLGVALAFFIVLSIGLSGYIVVNKFFMNDVVDTANDVVNNTLNGFSNTVEDIQSNIGNKTISDVSGKYTVVENSGTYTLNLEENGTFKYEYSENTTVGSIGSYYIDDNNNIILVYWFNTDSGTGLNTTKGKKALFFNDDGTIIDNAAKTSIGITSITLKKDGNAEEFDLSNALNVGNVSSDHKVSEPNV